MFNIIEVTDIYNGMGVVTKTETKVVFSSENLVDAVKYRYQIDPQNGYNVTKPYAGMTIHRHLKTEHNGVYLTFADIFRIVEGEEAYKNACESDVCYDSKSWIASK